ncbi:MAG: NAD(P)-dependent oxidoreductase [Peptococcia bacterium]
MEKMKVLVTASFSDQGIARLQEKMDVEYHNWLEQGRPNTQEELKKMVQGKDILIVETDEVHREVIEANPQLKIIGVCRGLRGDDPTIDIKTCNERKIPILYTPGRNFNSVAEFTILMTLAVIKKIRPATEWLHAKKWQEWLDFYTIFRTRELASLTVGLVGFGNIGRSVSRLFNAFGSKVIAYDPYVNDSNLYAQHNVEKVDLPTLLKTADVVSLHMNVSDETKSMIGAEEIALMKPTAYMINSARAAVIDHDALYEALKNKKIAGAAIDVFHQEPTGPDRDPLLTLDNVFATPHLAGTADEVIENHTNMVVDDLFKLLNGEQPKFLLNPDYDK